MTGHVRSGQGRGISGLVDCVSRIHGTKKTDVDCGVASPIHVALSVT